PHTNLLRLTVAAMGAAIGGADAITVLPFEPSGRPFARRMSRNIQRLMLEDAQVARLVDPAAGSGSLEALTDTIAEAAWALFKAHGAGDRDALLDGRFAALVAEDEAAERTIIGVTKHPPASPAPMPHTLAAQPARGENFAGKSIGAMLEAVAGGAALAMDQAPLEGFAPVRRAARYEEAAQ
ncbi:MAG: methylmalonyl-CoA mutase family protein, partial [Pseudomonadota bacterium]